MQRLDLLPCISRHFDKQQVDRKQATSPRKAGLDYGDKEAQDRYALPLVCDPYSRLFLSPTTEEGEEKSGDHDVEKKECFPYVTFSIQHIDIPCKDLTRASTFYEKVFNWKTEATGFPFYRLWKTPGMKLPISIKITHPSIRWRSRRRILFF